MPTASSAIAAATTASSAILAEVTASSAIIAVVTDDASKLAVAIVPPKVFNEISFKFVPSEYAAKIFELAAPATVGLNPVPDAVLIVRLLAFVNPEQSKM